MKNKNIKFLIVVFLFSCALTFFFASESQAANQINITAYVLNKNGIVMQDGDYDVRFSVYTKNRAEIDPYPSNSDSIFRIWQENQKVKISDGVMSVYLGSINSFPDKLDFVSGDFYLGIQIGTDSEMVPRKKIGSALSAISSSFLQGHSVGNQVGDIPLVTKKGLDADILSKINEVGTISQGTWEGDSIDSDFIIKDLTDKTYNGLNISKANKRFTLSSDSTNSLTLENGLLYLSQMGNPGSIVYSDGTSFNFSIQGTTGQVLVSNGNGAPTWGEVTGGIITNDSLNFTELADNMTLDNNLFISATSNNYSINFDSNTFFMDTQNNRIGINTAAPTKSLSVNGDAIISGTLEASALVINGEATIGTLGLNISMSSSLIPFTSGLNLGSSSNHWSNIYVDNLSVGGTDMNGTTSKYFTINTNSEEDKDMGLRFYRSTLNGYAALVWDAADSRFNLFKRENTSTYADLNLNNLYANGNVGIGTTSPAEKFVVADGDSLFSANGGSASDPDFNVKGYSVFDGISLFNVGAYFNAGITAGGGASLSITAAEGNIIASNVYNNKLAHGFGYSGGFVSYNYQKTLTTSGNTLTSNGNFPTAIIEPGMMIVFYDTPADTNEGIYKIVTNSDNNTITVDRNLSADETGPYSWKVYKDNLAIMNNGYVQKFSGGTYSDNIILQPYGGNVGIGTTTPSELLDVQGRIYLAQTTAPLTTTDRLYNVSGNLLWDGINLTAGGALPVGTEGQMMYNNAGAWTAFGNMYWDDTNSYLGIGTTSPSEMLEISHGNIALSETVEDIEYAPAINSSNWTKGNGWANIVEGILEKNGDSYNTAYVTTPISVAIGDVFKITVTVQNLTAGNFAARIGGSTSFYISSNGTTTLYLTATTTDNFFIVPSYSGRFQISGISIKKLNNSGRIILSNASFTSDGRLRIIKNSLSNPAVAFGASDQFGVYSDGNVSVGLKAGGATAQLQNGGGFYVSGSIQAPYMTFSNSVSLYGNVGTGILEQRYGTTTQAFRVYNTYASATNFERLSLDWKTNSNVATISTEAGSDGGTVRNIAIMGGNVGIGTTGPNELLSVYKNQDAITRIELNNPNTGTSAGTNLMFRQGSTDLAGNYFNNSDKTYKIATYQSGSEIFFSTENNERMRINNIGNVGIGTTSPASILNINGTVGALTGGLSFGDGDTGFYEYSDDVLRLQTGGSDSIYVTSGGNVGVGVSPLYKLHINGTIYTAGVIFGGYFRSMNSGNASLGAFTWNGDEDTGMFRAAINTLALSTAGTERLRIDSSGNIGIGTTSPADLLDVQGGNIRNSALAGVGNRAVYSDANGVLTNSSSDSRIKKNVKNISENMDVLSAIDRISGIYFNWDTDIDYVKNLGSQREVGFIAQNVQEVFPELVGINSSGYLSLDYAKFTPILLEGLKQEYALILQQEIKNNEQDTLISGLDLKTGVSITSISELQSSVDENLLIISGKFENLDQKINDNQDSVIEQISDLQKQVEDILAVQSEYAILSAQLALIGNKVDLLNTIFTYDATVKAIAVLGDMKLSGNLEAKKIKTDQLEAKGIVLGEQTMGKGTIKAGEKEIIIETDLATNDSKVYITPTIKLDGRTLYVEEDDIVSGKSFKIKLDGETSTEDITFNWLMFK